MTNPARQAAERITTGGQLACLLFSRPIRALRKQAIIIDETIAARDADTCQLISDLLRDLIIVHRYAELATKHRWSDWPTWTAENDQLTRERDEAREAARWLQGIWLSQQAMPDKQAELYAESTWKWLKESP